MCVERFFVLRKHLEYYPNEAAFKSNQKPYVIRLNAFFVAAVEGSTDHEFTIHAYPKSVTCRAKSAADMQEWIRALMEPVERKRRPIRTIQAERKAAEDKIESDAKTGEPIKGITIPAMAAEVASLAGASVGGGGGGGAGAAAGGGGGGGV